MAPSLWLRGVIVPIPKGADKDPCVPLNYRGITLLSCVYKVYSSVLNNRLVKYFDLVDAFVDEQNGFNNISLFVLEVHWQVYNSIYKL